MQRRNKSSLIKLKTLDRDELPFGLQRSPPRDVVLNSSGWVAAICAVALALAGILGGPLLAAKLAGDAADAAELRASGVAADAVVTRVHKPGGDNPRLKVSYRYTVEGRGFDGRVQLRQRDALARTVSPGSHLRVVHLPSRPDRGWLEGYGPRENPVWPAAILPAVGIPAALLIGVAIRRQRQLLEDGRAAVARITSAEKKLQNETSWRIAYTWRLPNGAERTGHVDRASQPSGSGSYLPILYDRDNPGRHSTWPLSLVKLRSTP